MRDKPPRSEAGRTPSVKTFVGQTAAQTALPSQRLRSITGTKVPGACLQAEGSVCDESLMLNSLGSQPQRYTGRPWGPAGRFGERCDGLNKLALAVMLHCGRRLDFITKNQQNSSIAADVGLDLSRPCLSRGIRQRSRRGRSERERGWLL